MRVAVTTSPDRAPAVAAELAAAGLEPVVLPCIRVEPASATVLAAARRRAAAAELTVVTSARAVRLVWPDGMPAGLRVAAVGEATADAARRAGGAVELVGPGGGEALGAALSPRVAGRRVAVVRAAEPAVDLAAALAAAGADVVDLAVYTTVPVGPAADPVDAAAFASPSAVAGWCLTRTLAGILAGAIGETTRRALADRGAVDVVVAPEPRTAALARALAAVRPGVTAR